jgi:hypothetical protein
MTTAVEPLGPAFQRLIKEEGNEKILPERTDASIREATAALFAGTIPGSEKQFQEIYTASIQESLVPRVTKVLRAAGYYTQTAPISSRLLTVEDPVQNVEITQNPLVIQVIEIIALAKGETEPDSCDKRIRTAVTQRFKPIKGKVVNEFAPTYVFRRLVSAMIDTGYKVCDGDRYGRLKGDHWGLMEIRSPVDGDPS